MEDAKWYFTHETEEDRLWYRTFLQCVVNSACYGRKPVKSKRLLLKKLLESIMKEKKRSEA